MSASPEPDFRELKRLLALKRHEQPPPGYFDFLAGQIQQELRAARRNSQPSRKRQGNLLHQFFAMIEGVQTRPAFAVGVGAVVCTLLVGAVVMFEQADPALQPTPSLLTEINAPPGATAPTQPVALDMNPMLASNAPAGAAPNLFDLYQPPSAMPAGFTNR